MKASEARELSQKGAEPSEFEMKTVYKRIELAAREGKTELWLDDKAGYDAVMNRLKKDGYKCKSSMDRNDISWHIQW